jgi:long-chain acyl-CoA synthetase
MSWTLAGVVRAHGADRPDRRAITYEGRSMSWRDLDTRSSQVAQALAAEGIEPQNRVAFIDKNSPAFFEIQFAAAKLNAVITPINWRLAPTEMREIINDAEARVLFVGLDFLDHLDAIEDGLRTVKKIVVLGDASRHEAYEAWLSPHPALDPGAIADQDDVAIQAYTSGTTGLPKGAMITNTFLGTMTAVAPRHQIDDESNHLVAMPLFHLGGCGIATLSMTAGANTILVRDINPPDLLQTIQREKVTSASLVPAVLQALTDLPEATDGDYSALRAIAYGASPITSAVLTRSLKVFGCDFVQCYGLTETGLLTQLDPADHDPGGPREHLLRSAGKPYPHVEMKIVDPDTGAERPRDEVGELWIRSAQMMKGYWQKPAETAEAITADGWLRTGDAGYIDGEGYVFLTDRIKDMIVSGAENIYPIEVENVLADHPAVADVAVIGVPDEKWGETVKAVIVLRPGASADPSELIEWCRQRLARYKCPKTVDFATELPRNASGKLLKRELREPYWVGRERHIN